MYIHTYTHIDTHINYISTLTWIVLKEIHGNSNILGMVKGDTMSLAAVPACHLPCIMISSHKNWQWLAARTKIAKSLSSKMETPEICFAFCSGLSSSICWKLSLLICKRTKVTRFPKGHASSAYWWPPTIKKKLGDIHGCSLKKGGWMGLICWYWRLHWDRWIGWRILLEPLQDDSDIFPGLEPIIWDVEPPQSQDKAHGCVDKYLTNDITNVAGSVGQSWVPQSWMVDYKKKKMTDIYDIS